MKLKATSLAITFLLSLIPAVAGAQDFSADVEYASTSKQDVSSPSTDTAPHHPSKLYVSKEKMRLETGNLNGTVLLVNEGDHSTVALFPGRKEYQDLAGGPSEYFRVEDPENACPDWQKASLQKIVCEKVGDEKVGGRDAVKYENKAPSETSATAVWVDKVLKFVVKWQSGSTTAELHNIKEATQAANLFVLPPDYTVVKPQKRNSKGFGARPR